MRAKIPSLHKSTEAIHAGGLKDTIYGEVSTPIFQSSTFSFSSAEDGAGRFSGEKGGFIYTRMVLEKEFTRFGVASTIGGTMDPHQAWLILRGIRTLPLRMEKGQVNAAELAGFLQQHPNVAWVKYPGLPEHPQHDIARKQMEGFGAMIAFGVKKGIEGGLIVMNNVQPFTLAVSLGGIESLIEHPASMTHASVPRAEREASGILDELVRVSVGCVIAHQRLV